MPVFGTESERVGTWRDGDGDGEVRHVKVRGEAGSFAGPVPLLR
jgi:hypothetical protein